MAHILWGKIVNFQTLMTLLIKCETGIAERDRYTELTLKGILTGHFVASPIRLNTKAKNVESYVSKQFIFFRKCTISQRVGLKPGT